MKNLMMLVLLVCSVLSMNAQNSVAIRGGVNFATQTVSGGGISINYDNMTGASVAVAFRIGVGETFAIQPEISFLQKGGSLTIFDETSSNRINYLEIPILAVYSVVNKDNFYELERVVDVDELFIYVSDFQSRGLVLMDVDQQKNFRFANKFDGVKWSVNFCLSDTQVRYIALLRKAKELVA